MKSLKKNLVFNILLNISSAIFPLITAPYVSRVLDPDGVGLFNFSYTYANYFCLIALLGIPTYGVREISKIRDDKVAMSSFVSSMFSISLITTVVISAIYLLSIALIGQLNENFIIFFLAGIALYLSPLKINWYYQGLEMFEFITLRTILVRTVSLICLFCFVHHKDDLIIYVVLNVFGGVVADVWNYLKMLKMGIRIRFSLYDYRDHIKPLLLLFASSVAISIYTILDTLMLGFMADYSEVGYYNNAMHLSRNIVTGVTSLSVVALPRMALYLKQNNYPEINRLMNNSFSIVSFLAFPITMGLICIAPTFTPLFFGEKFIGSILPLTILSFLILSIGFNNLTGIQVLIGLGKDKLFLFSVLTGTVSNFLLNCLLIPKWGAVGASISSVFAETLILAVTAYFAYTRTKVRINNWTDIIKALLGTLLFIPLNYYLRDYFTGWPFIGVFVFVCAVTYILLESLMQNSIIKMASSIVINKLRKFSK